MGTYRGYMGTMEQKMEAVRLYRGNIVIQGEYSR